MLNYKEKISQVEQSHNRKKRHRITALVLSLMVTLSVVNCLIEPAISMTKMLGKMESSTGNYLATAVSDKLSGEYFSQPITKADIDADTGWTEFGTFLTKVSGSIGGTKYTMDGTNNSVSYDAGANSSVDLAIKYAFEGLTRDCVIDGTPYIYLEMDKALTVVDAKYGPDKKVSDTTEQFQAWLRDVEGKTDWKTVDAHPSGYYSVSANEPGEKAVIAIRFTDEYIKYQKYLNEKGGNETISGTVGLSGKLGRADGKDGDQNVSFGGFTFNVTFDDRNNDMKKVIEEKKVNADGTYGITYKITVTNAGDGLAGYDVTDNMFPSDKSQVTVSPSGVGSWDGDTFKFTDNNSFVKANESATLTYTVNYTLDELNSKLASDSLNIANEANLIAPNPKDNITSTTETSLTKPYISKSGEAKADGYIYWTVIVESSLGTSLNGYTISDTYLDGGTIEKVTDGSDVETSAYTKTATGITIGDVNKIKVTYKTKITGDRSTDLSFTNTAVYSYPNGTEGEKAEYSVYVPQIKIDKSSVENWDDYDNGGITWTVTLEDPLGMSLNGYTISDNMLTFKDLTSNGWGSYGLGETKQDTIKMKDQEGTELVSGTDYTFTAGTNGSGTITINKDVTKVTLTYDTELGASWGYNGFYGYIQGGKGYEFKNTATYKSPDGDTGSDEEKRTVNSAVTIEKKANSYNPETNTIEWKITLYNQKGQSLLNTVIADEQFKKATGFDISSIKCTEGFSVIQNTTNVYTPGSFYPTVEDADGEIKISAVNQYASSYAELTYETTATAEELANGKATNKAVVDGNVSEASIDVKQKSEITKSKNGNPTGNTDTDIYVLEDGKTSMVMPWKVNILEQAGMKGYVYTDTISAGTQGETHTLNEPSLEVQARKKGETEFATLTAGTDYTITTSAEGFSITFADSASIYAEANITYTTTGDFSEINLSESNGKTINWTNNGYGKGEGPGHDAGTYYYQKTVHNADEKVSIDLTKNWTAIDGQTATPYNTTFQLKQRVKGSDTWANYGEAYTLPAGTTSYTFSDLPKYYKDDADGTYKEYEYCLEELTHTNGYVIKDENNQGIGSGEIKFENKYAPIQIQKEWGEGSEKTPITVTLYYALAKDNAEDRNWMKASEYGDAGKFVLNEANNWTIDYADYPYYDADGNKLIYKIVEDSIPSGYECSYSNYYGLAEGGKLKVTNKKAPLTLKKEWYNVEEANRTDVQFLLQRRIKIGATYSEWEDVDTYTISYTKENEWTYSQEKQVSVDRYDENGNKYEFQIVEKNIPTGMVASPYTSGDVYQITNKPNDKKLNVTKTWYNNSGDPNKPTEIEVTLQQRAQGSNDEWVNAKDSEGNDRVYTLNEANNWKMSDILVDWNDADGNALEFRFVELSVPAGYLTSTDAYNGTYFKISNTYAPIKIRKSWNWDVSQKKDVSVTLYKTDSKGVTSKVGDYTVKQDGSETEIKVNHYDEYGELYTFSVVENENNFSPTILYGSSTSPEGFTSGDISITNKKAIIPEKSFVVDEKITYNPGYGNGYFTDSTSTGAYTAEYDTLESLKVETIDGVEYYVFDWKLKTPSEISTTTYYYDKLPEGHTLYSGAYKTNSGSYTILARGIYNNYYDLSNAIETAEFEDGFLKIPCNQNQYIVYRTMALKSEVDEQFANSGMYKATNTIYENTAQTGASQKAEVSVEKEIELYDDKKILGKKGAVNGLNIAYTVKVNPDAMDLSPTDTLTVSDYIDLQKIVDTYNNNEIDLSTINLVIDSIDVYELESAEDVEAVLNGTKTLNNLTTYTVETDYSYVFRSNPVFEGKTYDYGFDLTVPDGRRYIVKYNIALDGLSSQLEDNFDTDLKEATVAIENKVHVETATHSDTKTEWKNDFKVSQSTATSETTVTPKIRKVDASNASAMLEADFVLARWNGVTSKWEWVTAYSGADYNTEWEISTSQDGGIPELSSLYKFTLGEVRVGMKNGVLYQLVEISPAKKDGKYLYTGEYILETFRSWMTSGSLTSEQMETVTTYTNTYGNTNPDNVTFEQLIRLYYDGEAKALTNAFKKYTSIFYFTLGNGEIVAPSGFDTDQVQRLRTTPTFTATNAKMIEMSATKTWDSTITDTNTVSSDITLYWSYTSNKAGFPDDIQVADAETLGILDEDFVATKTITYSLSDGADNSVKWENLPSAINGNLVYYYTKETSYTLNGTEYTLQPDGSFMDENGDAGEYSPIYAGNSVNGVDGNATIFNTKGLTLQKLWKDQNGVEIEAPEGIDSIQVTVQGMKNGSRARLYNAEGNNLYTLTKANGWKLILKIEDYPELKEFTSIEIAEVITDALTNLGAVPKYSCNFSQGGGIAIVTNTIESNTINLSITKLWADGKSTSRPENVTLILSRSKDEGATYETVEATLSEWTKDEATSTWKAEYKDLPIKTTDGITYTYKIEETAIPEGYVVSYDKQTVLATERQPSLKLTNSLQSSIVIRKVWDDSKSHTGDSITLNIYRSTNKNTAEEGYANTELTTESTAYVTNVELHETPDNWTKTLNLPACDPNGYAYYYWAQEVSVTGYTTTYSFTDEDADTTNCINATQSGDKNITVTNKPNVQAFKLPDTGGMGTQIFTTIGMLIMISSGALLLIQRKRRESDGE